ncbi:MAG TPA: UdgX family uracil-DNA binding protein [Candidatus Nitrosotalea sp.]|nr:UdgX family uracil-DNA binding protein [Candidatus Nitrosotalea sp.]
MGAAAYLPARHSLSALRDAAARCHGCDLYRFATQTVFGEGRAHARLMMVGEQPGDSEDRLGRPFVGPAGKLLHRAMVSAGVAPVEVYLTNAVKHFKFVERGKRRIHAKPKALEVRACKPWLDAEIHAIRPALIVALGATAVQSLLGSGFRLMANRGRIVSGVLAAPVLPTIHPSAILRAPDDASRHRELKKFIQDLLIAKEALHA